MNKLITLFVLGLSCFFASNLQAQNPCSRRYEQRVFDSIRVVRDVVYSKDAPKLTAAAFGLETLSNRDLKMDIFMPPASDSIINRPVVILAHGGGFVDIAFMSSTILVGTMDNEDVQALADTLAHWGFVAASIEYRTGFDMLSTTSVKRAVWRGSQDMSAAIRFFRKNAGVFGVDPNRVFIGGSSAGAFASIHATFVDDAERIPESEDQGFGMGDLGNLHSRPVVQITSVNPYNGNNVVGNDVDSIATALVGYWGAIADTVMFRGNNKAPIIMFHGEDDAVVDIDCARPFSGILFTAPVTCGSRVMNDALDRLGYRHEYYMEEGVGHEYWGVTNGLWGSDGPNAYWNGMIEKTAEFFYNVMRPNLPIVAGSLTVNPNNTYTYEISNHIITNKYCWNVTNGTIIANNNNSITIKWDNVNTGYFNVTTLDYGHIKSNTAYYEVNIQNPTSLTEFAVNTIGFEIFPNPNTGTYYIKTEKLPQENLIFQVIDLQGRLVQEAKYIADGSGIFQMQSADLAKGLYTIRAIGKNYISTQKLIIQ